MSQSNLITPVAGVVYEFEDYRFEPGTSRLMQGKDTLHLPPLEMDLLALLVKNHGRLVKHRMIWDTLWPGQDVSYDSLSRCVYSLRRVLGGRGKIIKSVPRKGYIFTAATKKIMPALKINSVIEQSIQTVPKAYSYYQLGMQQAGFPSYGHQERAIEFFHRAHHTDPNYIVPLGAIAEISMYQSMRGYLSPATAERQASEAINLALTIDPNLVSALAAKAWFEGSYHGNTQASLLLFDKAQALDPNHALTYFFRSWIERGAGQLQATMTTLTRGLEVDPLHFNMTHALAWLKFLLGHVEEALEIEQNFALDRPEVDVGHFYIGIFSSWIGSHKEAIRAGERGLAMSPDDLNAMSILSYILANAGHDDKARKLLDQARTITMPRPIALFLASTYLLLGEKDTALSLLQESRDINCPWFSMGAIDPRLESIRATPEFRALYDLN